VRKGTFVHRVTGELIEVEYPICPQCGAKGARCRRPSGHQADEWHIAREYLLAPLIGWPEWREPAPTQPTLF
jgi:hypothetical protein